MSPNGVGIPDFLEGLRKGRSGIRFFQELKDLGCDSPIVVAKNREEAEGLLRAAPKVGVSPVIVFTRDAVDAMAEAAVVVSTIPVEVGDEIGRAPARFAPWLRIYAERRPDLMR